WASQSLATVIPITTVSVGIGPIPAQVGSRTRRYVPNGGNGDDRAERDTGNDSAIIRSPHPWATKPIGSTGPAWWPTPGAGAAPARGAAPTGVCMRPRPFMPLAVRYILNSLNDASLAVSYGRLGVCCGAHLGYWLCRKDNA